MKRLELTDFEPHIGTTFTFAGTVPFRDAVSGQVEQKEIAADMLLTRVQAFELSPRDHRAKDSSGKYRTVPFSVYFEDQQTQFLPQAQYIVRHPAFAEPLELFITCIGPKDTGEGFLYEAVFG
jgi:hypothetical protein